MHSTILQWNIWYKEKIENIVRLIQELNPDIVCLQELSINGTYNDVHNTADYVKGELQYHMYFEVAQKLHHNDAIGNGIFSRYPIRSTKKHFLQKPSSKPPQDFSHEGRVYIEAEIQIDDTILTVGTTHLSYTPEFRTTEAKKKESDILVELLKDKSDAFIFTGDLNAPVGSYTLSEISKYFTNLGPDLTENTWSTKKFDYLGFKTNKLHWRLDHVLGTKDIKVISSKIIKTEYSDHLPILTEIEL
jgi:endonuclease/exonuclease/phosphatase family metal-dependent hydrolase